MGGGVFAFDGLWGLGCGGRGGPAKWVWGLAACWLVEVLRAWLLPPLLLQCLLAFACVSAGAAGMHMPTCVTAARLVLGCVNTACTLCCRDLCGSLHRSEHCRAHGDTSCPITHTIGVLLLMCNCCSCDGGAAQGGAGRGGCAEGRGGGVCEALPHGRV